MVDIWFKKLGFSRNPFSIKPAAFSYDLLGVNSDSLISGIQDGKVFFVEAPIGYGKTTLLKSIVHSFGGKNKVIYAHALPSEKIDVKDLLKRASLANYITGTLPKGMILVVDEAQNIAAGSSVEITELYKAGNLRAVVFFGTKYPGESFARELSGLLNGNVIRLAGPTPEQAVSIIRGRVGNLPVLSNSAIIWAYKRAHGSPRQLLQICEDICRSAVEKKQFQVSEAEFAATPISANSIASTTSTTLSSVPSAEMLKHLSFKKPAVSARRSAAHAKLVAKLSKQAKAAGSKNVKHASQKSQAQAKKSGASSTAVKVKTSKPTSKHSAEPKSKKQAKVPQKRAQKQQVKAVEPIPEGSYWGEFMGMQK